MDEVCVFYFYTNKLYSLTKKVRKIKIQTSKQNTLEKEHVESDTTSDIFLTTKQMNAD